MSHDKLGEFKARLLDLFSQTQEGTLCEQLLSLKQEGSIREYLQTFELLATALENALELILESIFINGLKVKILTEVRIVKPEGLKGVMKFA